MDKFDRKAATPDDDTDYSCAHDSTDCPFLVGFSDNASARDDVSSSSYAAVSIPSWNLRCSNRPLLSARTDIPKHSNNIENDLIIIFLFLHSSPVDTFSST